MFKGGMNLNEIALSSDIKQIELEINHHKNIAGQSIWEIGRRLNHVKENDLAHGEFMDWCTSIGFNRTQANRFMKISAELNYTTLGNLDLGTSALYLIATLPEPERTKEHTTEKGETKSPDEMTVKELQQLNKRVKLQLEIIEQKNDTINKQAEEVRKLRQQDPKVVTETVEVVPEDYEGLKESNAKLLRELQKAEYEATTVREAYDSLVKKRHQEDEGSRKYAELSRAIEEMQGKMSKGQKQLAAQKEVYDLVRNVNKLVSEVSPLTYLLDTETIMENEHAQKPIKKIIDNLRDMANRLEKNITVTIIEGEIIND